MTNNRRDALARSFINEFQAMRGKRDAHQLFTLVALHFGPACAVRLFPNLPPHPNAIAAVTA